MIRIRQKKGNDNEKKGTKDEEECATAAQKMGTCVN